MNDNQELLRVVEGWQRLSPWGRRRFMIALYWTLIVQALEDGVRWSLSWPEWIAKRLGKT